MTRYIFSIIFLLFSISCFSQVVPRIDAFRMDDITINGISTDTTFSTVSNDSLATQEAIKKFFNALSHAAVTLSGDPDYLILSGQDIELDSIDLANDVKGILDESNIDPDIARDSEISGTENYVVKYGVTGLTESVIYDSLGYIGVGITNPQSKFHVFYDSASVKLLVDTTGYGSLLDIASKTDRLLSVVRVDDGFETNIGINYTANSNGSGLQYVAEGAKKGPVINFNADNGSISIFGESGSGGNYRNPVHNLGLRVDGNGDVSTEGLLTIDQIGIDGSVAGGLNDILSQNVAGAFVPQSAATLGLLGTANISDDPFAVSWNGNTTDAASKNAIYDHLDTLVSVSDISLNDNEVAVGTGSGIEGDPNFTWNGTSINLLGGYIQRNEGTATLFTSYCAGTTASQSPSFRNYRSRGTLDVPTTVSTGDYVQKMEYYAHDGVGYNVVGQFRSQISSYSPSGEHSVDFIFGANNGTLPSNPIVRFDGDGEARFYNYGDGTFTGTLSYLPGFTSNGNFLDISQANLFTWMEDHTGETVGDIYSIDGLGAPVFQSALTLGIVKSTSTLTDDYVVIGKGTKEVESSLLLYDSGTNFGVGLTGTEARIHVADGTAGSVSAPTGTRAIIEASANNYLQFQSPTSALSGILWGDQDDNDNGRIVYDYTGEDLDFYVGGGLEMQVTSAGVIVDTIQTGFADINGDLDLNHGATNTLDITNTETELYTPYFLVDGIVGGVLRIGDTGANYAALKTPGTLSASYTLTLPPDDGDDGDVLTTDGAGVTTWESPAFGEMYITDADPDTITITSGTPAEGTDWTTGSLSDFTYSAGRLTYTGTKTINVKVNTSISFTHSVNNTIVESWIYENGAVVSKSEFNRKISTGGDVGNSGQTCILNLATNDYIELFFDSDNSGDVIIYNANVNISKI